MARVTIMMLIGKATHNLEKAFLSLANQTLQDYQLVICTNSEELPPNLPTADSIQVIHDGTTKDHAIRFNEMIALATTPLLMPIDAEDTHNPNKVKFLVEVMEHPDNNFLSATGVEARILDDKGADTKGWMWVADTPEKVREWCGISKPALIHGSSIMRKDHVLAINGYDPKWKVLYDVDLYSRLIIVGYFIQGIPGIATRYTDYYKGPTKVIAVRKGLVEERIAMRDFHREQETWENWGGYTKVAVPV